MEISQDEDFKINSSYKNWAWFLGVILVMQSIEIGYFLNSPFKRVTGFLWIGVAVGMFIFAAGIAVSPFFKRSFWNTPGQYWYLAAFFIPLPLIYLGVNGVNWTAVNNEGIQQVNIGLDFLKHDPEFGVYQLGGYSRYLARQYLLTSIPSLLFGPSFLALRVGNSLIYVISYLAFLSRFQAYLEFKKVNSLLWASWAGMMISLGQYTLIQARSFEQTTMPIGATLMFIAALFHFLIKPIPTRGIWIAWSLSFLTAGYTPAYASWCFGACVLIYLAFNSKIDYKILGVSLWQGCLSLFIAILMLHQQGQPEETILRIGPDHFAWYDWLWRYFSGLTAVFNADYSVIPIPLGIAGFTVLFLSIKQREWRVVFSFIWSMGVVLASLTLYGSCFNVPHYDVHRSIIIIPIIAVGVVLFYIEYYSNHSNALIIERLVVITIIYMIYTSLSFPFLNRRYFCENNISDLDEAALRISEVTSSKILPPIKSVFIDPQVNLLRDNLMHSLKYFAPNADIIQTPEPESGSYTLSYNGHPMGDNENVPSKNPRPYLVLNPSIRSKSP